MLSYRKEKILHFLVCNWLLCYYIFISIFCLIIKYLYYDWKCNLLQILLVVGVWCGLNHSCSNLKEILGKRRNKKGKPEKYGSDWLCTDKVKPHWMIHSFNVSDISPAATLSLTGRTSEKIVKPVEWSAEQPGRWGDLVLAFQCLKGGL